MILAIPLVFVLGGFLGWWYGQRNGRKELGELRRQKQISRIGTREQLLKGDQANLSELEVQNSLSIDTSSRHLAVSASSSGDSASLSSPTALHSLSGLQSDSETPGGEQDLDELYTIAGRVLPLEHDLTQRKLEVKALKQALQDVRRINEKQLVSVRLQAENKARLHYKEKLTEKQIQIDSLSTKLSGVSTSESQLKTLQTDVERMQVIENESTRLRSQSELQLDKIGALMEQCDTLETQRNALQNDLTELRRERIDLSGSVEHFNTQIADREKQLGELREKQFLVEQKNQDLDSTNAQISSELSSSRQRLAGSLESLTQSEKRAAELQKQVSELNLQVNSNSAELATARTNLTESDERNTQLADRLKRFDSEIKQLDTLNNKLKNREADVGKLTTHLNNASVFEVRYKDSQRDNNARLLEIKQRDGDIAALVEQVRGQIEQVTELKTELSSKDERIVVLQERSEQIPDLEAIIARCEQELTRLREQAGQVKSLQLALIEKDEHIVNLRKQSDRVMSLESAAKTRASQILKLSERVAQADEFEHQLADKDKRIAALQKLEIKFSDQEQVIADLKRECASVTASNKRLENTQVQLRHELSIANEAALLTQTRKAKTADADRLKSAALEAEQHSVSNRRLENPVRDVAHLEADIRRRDQQIGELKSQLNNVQRAPAAKTGKQKNQSKTTKTLAPQKPLYVAPAEKDDLKRVNGIGPVMEKMLNSLGITSFKQLAEFNSEDINKVTAAIDAFPGRIERDNWVGGAKEQYAKKYQKADA